ncbi:PAS domain-containing hybrid sensor histidine kinase/response regulator [Urbifossiella limnaea]|uniref:histidine kinase n=1 Tax=Urbifossiella limnaea TaxID=2528023 RepID=A0A517XVI8_9BACT|nr:PAS domain S-box protein [Urbifossiella limnaea]QDU21494.1 Blue-light-activated protein [Urbifossiella limnaea]
MSQDASPSAPSLRELASHLENTPLAVIAWDREGRVRQWGGQAERMFGWTAGEAFGRHTFEIAPPHPDDLARVDELVRDMLAARRPRAVMRNRNIARDGRVVWCEWYNSVVFDDTGEPASSLSLVLDVSDRVAAEQALQWGETRLRQVLRGAGMLGWDWDFATSRVHATADIGEYFGLPAGQEYVTGEAAWEPIHPDDRPVVVAQMEASARTGGDFVYQFRGSAPGADGRDRWFSARGRTLLNPAGKPLRIVAVTAEITERVHAENEQEALGQQLLDAQKWESLGVLAGGIAHDFNNILTVVLGSAGLAQRHVPPGSPAAPYLEQIEKAAQRAAGLCREMLAYAGRGPAPGGTTDLSRLVRDAQALLEVSTTRHARVQFDLGTGLPPVRADNDQVRRVLVNLVMNAGEAVGDGGRVVVRAGMAEVTGAESAEHFRLAPAPGEYVLLSVTDDGPGIPTEAMGRLFDPFFTTKFPGRGLGLAAVLGIVKTHRGGIRVESAAGRGTTFEVYWPPASPATRPRQPDPKPVAARVALVVDDEMFVREVAASTLEDAGYSPILAGDGTSALEAFRANRAAVWVVVSDVVMPGMTGDELLARIRAEAPDTPAVLISGYSDRRTTARDPRTEFLQKPFHPEELAAAVERVVNSAAPPG